MQPYWISSRKWWNWYKIIWSPQYTSSICNKLNQTHNTTHGKTWDDWTKYQSITPEKRKNSFWKKKCKKKWKHRYRYNLIACENKKNMRFEKKGSYNYAAPVTKAKSNYRRYNRKSSSHFFLFIFPFIIVVQTSACILSVVLN